MRSQTDCDSSQDSSFHWKIFVVLELVNTDGFALRFLPSCFVLELEPGFQANETVLSVCYSKLNITLV